MDYREVLERVVQKALDDGWQPRNYEFFENDEKVVAFDVWKRQSKKITFFTEEGVRFAIPFYELIFDHYFAKVLWPTDGFPQIARKAVPSTPTYAGKKAYSRPPSWPIRGSWQYHLQQMAISDDVIKYLGDNT